ncbi:Enoyl-(acyl-carrier-protein) reductase (NADH) (NADH-dependent enoyl-ACP reductase) [Hyphomicrobium sp. GJ21]|jgi:enoyl-[acyl-carrier protein] reductase I|uniref:Enoyl-[acyl-carrier-protein] reductase [NADH] n=1 Tax=Hyphomicrobium denitrificans (strain ATCC 51888 / DSM 1869 / NCIMB 11706 / TK 0415) TaxID=582899 RepID=D8JY92_HYPDA|nr:MULTISPECIES: enoyl-ACP reductase FabI [Hyphomicrobium]ADJ25296.1 short-chain dehydrogenase/reductase SDR [Hyphomicrobium denitrificans ATCC 51888]CEJ83689.1 Enoyl-(acyl-carrier-protein) reductase (NADH) (NADH-dependent enoyl-ACP reductase) [Hyphomicrobium sp. GJ21]
MTDIDIAKPGPIMAGKRGLVMGVANDRSIAWGIARVLAGQGAELAFTYQGGAFGRRAAPLAQSLGAKIIEECNVLDLNSVDRVFDRIKEEWGGIDFVVHALAFSDPKELSGRYADTTRENFINSMVISCFSFTEIAKRASALMHNGGSLITLSYGGATRWVPSYNVMGVAKAALEASVRYLAADLGPQGIRVNALSAGPMRTLSGAGVSDARVIFNFQRDNSPLQRTPTLDEVAGSALYLLSPLSGAVTGEVHFVDCGYNTVSMPSLQSLKEHDSEAKGPSASPSAAAE